MTKSNASAELTLSSALGGVKPLAKGPVLDLFLGCWMWTGSSGESSGKIAVLDLVQKVNLKKV